jgi:hypothetical protein
MGARITGVSMRRPGARSIGLRGELHNICAAIQKAQGLGNMRDQFAVAENLP